MIRTLVMTFKLSILAFLSVELGFVTTNIHVLIATNFIVFFGAIIEIFIILLILNILVLT
jgi:hypothetical protein